MTLAKSVTFPIGILIGIIEEFRCHLLFFNRNSWRILMTNVVFLSEILEEFWWHVICWLILNNSVAICCFSNRNSWKILKTSVVFRTGILEELHCYLFLSYRNSWKTLMTFCLLTNVLATPMEFLMGQKNLICHRINPTYKQTNILSFFSL